MTSRRTLSPAWAARHAPGIAAITAAAALLSSCSPMPADDATSADTDRTDTTIAELVDEPVTTLAEEAEPDRPPAEDADVHTVDEHTVDEPGRPSLDGGGPDVVATEVLATTQPIGLAVRPGDDRLFVIDQDGRIVAADTDTGAADEVADLRDLTEARGEQGLLGLAFSTDGERAYVNHTDLRGDTVIAEYRLTDDGRFDIGSRRILLEIEQPYGNHNGGRVVIGPDGMLYIGMGDGGSGGDPQRLATDLTSLYGALLRIDPTPGPDGGYQIPADNPFLGVEGARPELFAIGLRNPWGFGFDPITGDLWLADVGQNQYEELNLVRARDDGGVAGAGVHFGWSAFEGFSEFNDDVIVENHHRPVLVYEHGDAGCSITGGDVYRNGSISELESAYIFSDYCSGRLWAFDAESDLTVVLVELERVTAVSRGPDDELWVASHTGTIWRIDPADDSSVSDERP
jgi:glucose/arabinose dehydrogenase